MGLLATAFSLALPPRCAACGAWGRVPLCAACERAVRWITAPICDRCGRPTEYPVERCRDCRGRRLGFDRARAAALYAGPAREALKAFKLLGERRNATALAAAMVPAASGLGGDAVTWVPATRRAEAGRGFNPAEEIARRLGEMLGLPAPPMLAKVRETRDQSGLSRTERRANLRGAFAALGPVTARGPVAARVLLVDDVMTTGATAYACASALKRAGARRVSVVTFARAL